MTPDLRRVGVACWLALAGVALAAADERAAPVACGIAVTVDTARGSTLRYALVAGPGSGIERDSLVLLVGGGGRLELDEQACPQALNGNSLARFRTYFHAAGFVTALVDAPSDYRGEDGLSGPAAPDGLVLTSALMSGRVGGPKPWLAQTVFDLSLENLQMPALIVGHGDDKCLRSPPELMARLAASITRSSRKQVVTVSGGPAYDGPPSLAACEGKAPHGYVGQDAAVSAGIGRFIRGERY